MTKTLLVIGTRKGAFLAESENRRDWELRGPFCESWPVYQAIHDISIANELGTFPTSGDPKRPLSQKLTVIRGLAALQSEV